MSCNPFWHYCSRDVVIALAIGQDQLNYILAKQVPGSRVQKRDEFLRVLENKT
jgi:hypothetical protein